MYWAPALLVFVCLFLTLFCLLFLCEQEVMSGCGGAVQQVEQRRRLQRKQDLTGTLTDSSSAEWIHGLSTQRYRDIYNLVLQPSVLAALSSCQHAVRFHLQQVQRPSAFPQYTVTDISPSCPAHSHQPIATEHCVNWKDRLVCGTKTDWPQIRADGQTDTADLRSVLCEDEDSEYRQLLTFCWTLYLLTSVRKVAHFSFWCDF